MTASATDTYLLLRAFCDELARCGMQHACTSPGSRCTPIVLSLVRDRRIACWSHVDERCAGFFALGAAKASGRPVAVTCTSGTAAANLVPAVIEAREARVPMIVLTADRPPELRDIGAGQAIDQLKLYGDAVKWFFEVGVHEAGSQQLRWMRTLACRAYWSALDGRPGPVHLNFPLREPLVLDGLLPQDDTARAEGRPYVVIDPSPRARPSGPRHPSGRIAIVAGASHRDAEATQRLPALAARGQIPLLADPQSGMRHGPAAIAHYDLLLRDERFAAEQRPDFVIRLGDLPTSKALRGWLADLDDVAQIAIDPDGTWQDPASVVGMRLTALPLGEGGPAPADWLTAWRRADDAAEEAIDEVLGEELSEPLVARRLFEWLPAQATLFVASSMPVRDLESFAPARAQAPRVLANRGANGIDGTVSSAFGTAASTGEPVVLLIGDVALAHDVGGLLAASRLKLPLTIVLLNNDGGGIFHFLPVAGEKDVFEQHVATPTGLDFARAADLYGLGYERADTQAGLQDSLERAIGASGAAVIEVPTDREANLVLHRRVAAEVSRRAGAASLPA